MSQNIQSNIIIRSDLLKTFRKLEENQKWIGPLAQFKIVIDANILLGDLIWLVCKRKTPGATTELMECISAGTIQAYVTRMICAEVEEKLSKIADQQHKDPDEFRKEWKVYKKSLKIKTPPKKSVAKYAEGEDPDDAPTLALADLLKADGILTKDKHLPAMGGFCLELDFTRQARDYSRKIVVTATIKYGLGQACIVVYYSGKGLADALSKVVCMILDLPSSWKMIIFMVGLAAFLHPETRDLFSSIIKNIANYGNDVFSSVMSGLSSILEMAMIYNISPPLPIENRALRTSSSKVMTTGVTQ